MRDYQQFRVSVPDGKSGDWEVDRFEIKDDMRSMFYNLDMIREGFSERIVQAGTYTRLTHGYEVIMSDTPAEIRDFYDFWSKAEGTVLLNGLGLGVLLQALLKKPEITHVTAVEISDDVLHLVADYYTHMFRHDRLSIIHADAFTWSPPRGTRYNYVFHDLWAYVNEESNYEDMKRLHRKYGRRCDVQESWCRREVERERRREVTRW